MGKLVCVYRKRKWVPWWLWRIFAEEREMDLVQARTWIKAIELRELDRAIAIIDAL
jgi:hypothetical protein